MRLQLLLIFMVPAFLVQAQFVAKYSMVIPDTSTSRDADSTTMLEYYSDGETLNERIHFGDVMQWDVYYPLNGDVENKNHYFFQFNNMPERSILTKASMSEFRECRNAGEIISLRDTLGYDLILKKNETDTATSFYFRSADEGVKIASIFTNYEVAFLPLPKEIKVMRGGEVFLKLKLISFHTSTPEIQIPEKGLSGKFMNFVDYCSYLQLGNTLNMGKGF